MEFPDRPQARQVATVLIVLLILTAPVLGETLLSGFFATQGQIHYQTDNGLEVVTTKNYQVQSGNPFTASSMNVSTQNHGWVNVSSSGSGSVTIDEINGTHTNVSAVDASAANITLNPSDKNKSTIGGGITAYKFRAMGGGAGETGVNDGKTDLIYSASSTGTIVVNTNATPGTQYGLVNAQTNEGLDVGVADSNGQIAFTDVPTGTTVKVRIQELGTLSIRTESPPHDKITGSTAEVKFFEESSDSPTIVERSASNGEVDLTGIPVDEQFVVTVKASNYHNRSVLIKDLSQQETVFLSNKSKSTVNTRFLIRDKTGLFPPDKTEIIVQKAINHSKFSSDRSGFAWTTMAGDNTGADAAYVVDLQQEDRYRLIVRNNAGESRTLGSYTAESSGTIELEIGQINLKAGGKEGYAFQAKIVEENGNEYLKLVYRDPEDKTSQIQWDIRERGNVSNSLDSGTVTGEYGTWVYTYDINDSADRNYNVSYSITRGGTTNSSYVYAGGVPAIATQWPIDNRWLTLAGYVGVVAVAGLLIIVDGSLAAVGAVIAATLFTWLGILAVHPALLGFGAVTALVFSVAGGDQ